jgi:hypothetical protein
MQPMKRKGCGPQGLGSPIKQTGLLSNKLEQEPATREEIKQALRDYAIKNKDNVKPQDMGGGAFAALYGGGAKMIGKGLMNIAGKLAKNPKTAKIASTIQKAVSPNAGKSAKTLNQENAQRRIAEHQKFASKRGQRRPDGTRI